MLLAKSLLLLSLFLLGFIAQNYPVATAPGTVPRAVASQVQSTSKTQIVMLGTGTPNADPDRFGPSVAIVVNDTPYIGDFGTGVVRRAAAAQRKGITGLTMPKLTKAFLTHLHSDHTTGYADLIFTPWVLERKEPLEVYGPKGLKAMTAHIVKAYQEDLDMRLYGLEPSNKTGYKVNAHEINTSQPLQASITLWLGAQSPEMTIVLSGVSKRKPYASFHEPCLTAKALTVTFASL